MCIDVVRPAVPATIDDTCTSVCSCSVAGEAQGGTNFGRLLNRARGVLHLGGGY